MIIKVLKVTCGVLIFTILCSIQAMAQIAVPMRNFTDNLKNNGKSSNSGAIILSTCVDLQNIGNLKYKLRPQPLNGNYILDRDIDCSGINNFTPIIGPSGLYDDDSAMFQGVLDGKGHSINNLTIAYDHPTLIDSYQEINGVKTNIVYRPEYGGLFVNIKNATIKNLKFKNIVVKGAMPAGGLAANCYSSVVENVQVSGVLDTLYNDIGNSSLFLPAIGGLVGNADGCVFRKDASDVSVRVTIPAAVGGLIGEAVNSQIIQSYSKNVVRNEVDLIVGGLVGDLGQSTILNSYSTATVQGHKYAGGLVEQVWSSNIINSFFAGKGVNQKVLNGIVNFDFAGNGQEFISPGTVENSFWDKDVYGASDANVVVKDGSTTAQMKNAETYKKVGWDFKNIWMIDQGKDYPHLLWEASPKVTVHINGIAPVKIFSEPQGLACTTMSSKKNICSATFEPGTKVKLIAKPLVTSAFVSDWGIGSCNASKNSDSCSITVLNKEEIINIRVRQGVVK